MSNHRDFPLLITGEEYYSYCLDRRLFYLEGCHQLDDVKQRYLGLLGNAR